MVFFLRSANVWLHFTKLFSLQRIQRSIEMTVIFRWFFFVTFPSLKSNFFLCLQLMMILIKVSDISNEARPMEVAEPWLDCLLQEFYNQVWSAVLACVRNRCWDQSGVYEISTYTTVRAQSRSKVFKMKTTSFYLTCVLRVTLRNWRVSQWRPSWTQKK